MTRPSKQRIIQFIKYFLGGSVWFWSGYIVFAVCYSGLGLEWWVSKIIADIVGFTLNYLVQRYWAFNNPELARHEGRNRLRYILVSMLNIGLDYLIVGGLKYVGISPYIGMFIAAGFFTVWNYVCYRWWIFPEEYSKEYNKK